MVAASERPIRSALVSVALLTACTSSARDVPTSHAPTRVSPTTSTVPIRTCEQAIGVLDPAPEPGVGTILLGRVWIPSTPSDVIHAARPRTSEGNLFYKQGISVRAGPPIEMAVPRSFSDRYSLDYTSTPIENTSPLGEGEETIRVAPCPADALGPWTAFSGGFLAPTLTCVEVIVRADGRTERLRLALGTACP